MAKCSIPQSFTRIFKNKVIMYLFDDAAKQKRASLFAGCEEGLKDTIFENMQGI